jgi:hypothetical protein
VKELDRRLAIRTYSQVSGKKLSSTVLLKSGLDQAGGRFLGALLLGWRRTSFRTAMMCCGA